MRNLRALSLLSRMADSTRLRCPHSRRSGRPRGVRRTRIGGAHSGRCSACRHPDPNADYALHADCSDAVILCALEPAALGDTKGACKRRWQGMPTTLTLLRTSVAPSEDAVSESRWRRNLCLEVSAVNAREAELLAIEVAAIRTKDLGPEGRQDHVGLENEFRNAVLSPRGGSGGRAEKSWSSGGRTWKRPFERSTRPSPSSRRLTGLCLTSTITASGQVPRRKRVAAGGWRRIKGSSIE